MADMLVQATAPGLTALSTFLNNRPAETQTHVTFLIPLGLALSRMLDTSPHKEQAASIRHLERIDTMLTMHPNITINIHWLPRKIPFVGF